MKQRPQDRRTFDSAHLQRDSRCHPQDPHLVPGYEHLPETQLQFRFIFRRLILFIIVFCHGERRRHHQDILGCRYQLYIGKPDLPVHDESAQPANGPDIGKHGGNHIGAPVQIVVKTAGKQFRADNARNGGNQHTDQRQPQKLRRQRQHPETHQRKNRNHYNHVKPDQPVAEPPGHQRMHF